jgi:ankyrin repeat protein
LHEACCQGRADLVALLLEAKADATCTTYKRKMGGGGTTPLAVALDQEHAACAALLERSSTSNVECP